MYEQQSFETNHIRDQDIINTLIVKPKRIGELAAKFDVSVTALIITLNRLVDDGVLTTDNFGYYHAKQENK